MPSIGLCIARTVVCVSVCVCVWRQGEASTTIVYGSSNNGATIANDPK